jgi:hypothetical protein
MKITVIISGRDKNQQNSGTIIGRCEKFKTNNRAEEVATSRKRWINTI